MLSANNIAILFGGEALFSGISFKINKGDRVGLAGKNGAGKTTLMKMLCGDLKCDEGSISTDGDLRIGILRQDIDFEDRFTLIEEIEHSFTEIKQIETRIKQINSELEVRTDYQSDSYTKILEELHDLTHKFDLAGGYTFAGDIERILVGLGFERDDFEKSTKLFSGGWRMRIELAKLLLQNNDILLLDEPTNHLDIESILWLEDFLNKFSGAVILVSHDRTFLDNITNRTIEISAGRIYDFKKSYTQYLELRSEIRDKQIATRKNQEKEIKQTEQLIEKFRYKASKAAFAQSLIKKLEKTELIDVDTDEVAAMNLKFQVDSPSGKVVFKAEDVRKSFEEPFREIEKNGKLVTVEYTTKQVLKGIDLEVQRGDKIAFVGKNGQGKTTFMRCLLGQFDYQGEIENGYNVHLGYFAQNQKDTLDMDKTLIQTIEDEATETMRPRSRDLLGSFLFGGDAVDKKVKVLSGGERGRLAMCKLLVRPFNVLLMDEPTNHLDIRSKAILKQALQAFDGTLILVSHDRDFLDGLTNKVYEFKDGYAKEYLGDINFYLEQRQIESFRDMEMERIEDKKAERAAAEQPVSDNQLSYEQRKASEKESKRLSNKISNCEVQIEDFEIKITEMDKMFAADGFVPTDEHFSTYQKLKNSLEAKMSEWEQAQDELSKLKNT